MDKTIDGFKNVDDNDKNDSSLTQPHSVGKGYKREVTVGMFKMLRERATKFLNQKIFSTYFFVLPAVRFTAEQYANFQL